MAVIRHWLARKLDVVVLIAMMASICRIGLVLSDAPVVRDSLNALDESWEIDLMYKASRGIWSGRDFAFTYGALWQWLASILPRFAGLSLGSVSKISYLFDWWGSFVLAFLTSRLLLIASPGWKRAVFLAGLAIFWLPMDVRPVLAVTCFAAYYRLIEELPADRRAALWRAAAVTLLLTLGFIMAGDAGALSAAGLFSVVVAYIATHLGDRAGLRRVLRWALYCAGFLAIWVVIVNAWAARPWQFRFWIWTVDIITTFRWTMAAPMAPEAGIRLAWTFLGCMAVYVAAWIGRDEKSPAPTMHPCFLLAVTLFSCIALQKGVVRSDWGHIGHCMLPAISMAGAILVSYRNHARPYLSNLTVLGFVLLTITFSGPAGLLGWKGLIGRVAWMPPAFPSCPPGTYYLSQACVTRPEYAIFGLTSGYIRDHSAPGDRIVVYPYENLLGVLSGRTVSVGVLQNYSIGGQELTDLQISALERDGPPLGVYCSDDVVSWPVDGTSNFQRTAQVWFYLQSRYAAEAEPAAGVTAIRRDERRAQRVVRTEKPLWRGPRRSSSNALAISIDRDAWISAEPDFVHLQMRVEYPIWWKLTKPSAITAVLRFSDGSTKTSRLAVEPNAAADVWIYPWEEVSLKNYFKADAREWRPDRVLPALTGIEVSTARFDPLSAIPSYIEVSEIDGTVLSMNGGEAPLLPPVRSDTVSK